MSEKFVRFLKDGKPSWGRIIDDTDPLEVKAILLVGRGRNLNLSRPDYENFTSHLKEAADSGVVTIKKGEFLPPVSNPPNIWAAGLNYYEHGIATGQITERKRAPRPTWFPKWTNSIAPHASTVYLPEEAPDVVDYEVELAVIIGKPGKDIPVEKAHEHVAAVTTANDVSARDIQGVYPEITSSQWGRAKSYDTFCPLGYWVTDVDVSNLEIKLELNGEMKQIGNTGEMIFSVPELIHFMSRGSTVLSGTVLLTGTPKGTAIEKHIAKEDARFLRDGDVMTASIQEVGSLVNFIKKT